jgi:hypothetical protein
MMRATPLSQGVRNNEQPAVGRADDVGSLLDVVLSVVDLVDIERVVEYPRCRLESDVVPGLSEDGHTVRQCPHESRQLRGWRRSAAEASMSCVSLLSASKVPKSVSAETRTRPSFLAKANITSSSADF